MAAAGTRRRDDHLLTQTAIGVPPNAQVVGPMVWALASFNTASWTPTISVKIPAGVVAGTYKGTVTHSVL
jgi:hypothetical protein